MNFSNLISRAAAFAIGVLLISAAQPASAQERVTIPNTIVSMVAPAGFKVAPNFAGLINEEKKTSVLVVEFPPAAKPQLSALFGDLNNAQTNFAKQNIVIEELETIDAASGKIQVAIGQQGANGITLDKWIALAIGSKVVMVTVQAPEDSDMDGDVIKDLLKSIKLD